MIVLFKDKNTKKIWYGTQVKKPSLEIQKIGRRKLRMLNNSKTLDDLKLPPSNRLEALKGDRKGQFSIRINDQWRICFKWKNGNCEDVELVDYHT